MALMKFRAFNKMIKEIKARKEYESKASTYKKIYLEKLSSYGVKDASELSDEQLSEFLEGMKSYRNGGNINPQRSL
jgi:hypothetical protein